MKHKPLLYRVTPSDPAGHQLQVSLILKDPDPAGQLLSMPAWIPGSYLIRDFSRHVTQIRASARGKTVPIRKTGSHAWRCDSADGPLHVDYTVYAWDLSVRGAHFDETHAFFNGTSLFLAPQGRTGRPCLLELLPPPHTRRWKVHTSLPEARNHPARARRHGFGMYLAPNYDALIDHPVEMGTPQVARFQAHGAEHELVFTGVAPNIDLPRMVRDIRRICAAQIALFDPEHKRAPFLDSSDRYVFMTMVTGDGYGGLEHRSSTALMTARADLPTVGREPQDEGYQRFLGLVSHEYFHTWHVKRIKPAAFAPYDLAQENHTKLLWVFEGFTSYYDDLMLLRSGVIDEAAYFRLLAATITNVHRGPGRRLQSIADSSFDAWTRFYKQDENSPNAIVSYYTKGALAALGLDLLIQRESRGRRSLDDVMRMLWRRYGRDFYRGKPHGVPEDAMAGLIHEATGVDAAPFLQQYVYGTEDLPLASLLEHQGIQLQWTAASAIPSLDARFRASGAEVHLASVFTGGAAHAAGLSAGDALVAIDGLRVQGTDGLNALLQARRPGDKVRVHVFRRDELRRFDVILGKPPADTAKLTRQV